MPVEYGSVTPRAAAVATAASTAFPPLRRTSMPACVASGSTLDTAPPVPSAVAFFSVRCTALPVGAAARSAGAAAGWAEIKRRLAEERHDLYVLDEFTYVMEWGWVDLDDVIETLSQRPGRQYVVVTGRRAHPRLVEVADLVTEMTKVKHQMDRGQKGQKGIEW